MHTLILGASTNPSSRTNRVIHMLVDREIEVTALGIREGEIAGITIQHGHPVIEDIHTISLYLNETRQEAYYDYILSLKPKRHIFNPGTENLVLSKLARNNDIDVVVACSLVLLSLGEY